LKICAEIFERSEKLKNYNSPSNRSLQHLQTKRSRFIEPKKIFSGQKVAEKADFCNNCRSDASRQIIRERPVFPSHFLVKYQPKYPFHPFLEALDFICQVCSGNSNNIYVKGKVKNSSFL
jgi:hypothetical protein